MKMLGGLINIQASVDRVHTPFYFEHKNICVRCGAEGEMVFIDKFGRETTKDIYPFENIKCKKCGGLYSIKWDKGEDGKMYPSAVDPSMKQEFVNAIGTAYNYIAKKQDSVDGNLELPLKQSGNKYIGG
jgi:hypothetical protein